MGFKIGDTVIKKKRNQFQFQLPRDRVRKGFVINVAFTLGKPEQSIIFDTGFTAKRGVKMLTSYKNYLPCNVLLLEKIQ